jgi:hypothetical protein
LICNQLNGGALKPKAIWNMMNQLEKRIKTLEQKYENDMQKLREDMNNQLVR